MKPTVVNILLVISFSKSNCLSQLFVLERSKTVGLHIPRGIGGGPERGGNANRWEQTERHTDRVCRRGDLL